MVTRAPRAGGPDGQLAPAGADLQQRVPGADPGEVEQPVDLAVLGGREQAAARRGKPWKTAAE